MEKFLANEKMRQEFIFKKERIFGFCAFLKKKKICFYIDLKKKKKKSEGSVEKYIKK